MSQPERSPRDSLLTRFMLGFEGESLPAELEDHLGRGLAGVALYPRNFSSPEHLRDLTASIRKAAGRPVLIGIDQEGGTRFSLREPFTAWPSPAELGRLDDPEAVEQVARAIGMELQAVGCNLNFAPMLDLHINPESPVTKDRSFGSSPDHVARLGVAFHRGLRSAGVLSCAKHFPGHGDASVDPHLDLPVFSGTLERLKSMELVPFAPAIAQGVPLVMTAHILLPQIDGDHPASLSRKLLDGVLRQYMGFSGVILADDLGMGAIAKRYGTGEAAVQTFLAGTDIAMLCHDWSLVAAAMTAVGKARDAGRFDEQEWCASLRRIDLACSLSESSSSQPGLELVGGKEHRRIANEVRARLG